MLKMAPKSSVASKKFYERSEFRVAFDLAFAFLKVITGWAKKLPHESSVSEIQ